MSTKSEQVEDKVIQICPYNSGGYGITALTESGRILIYDFGCLREGQKWEEITPFDTVEVY